LVSDPGSAIIKRFGLLNQQQDPKSPSFGVPHPGTFIVNRGGVVQSRFFEDAYQERYTAATILATRAGAVSGAPVTTETSHLTVRTSVTDTTVAPGERLSIIAEVGPRPSMHVYAPGKHSYRVVRLVIDAQPWLRIHETTYPASEVYHFKPLDERVAVYSKPFRLTRDVTILATPEMQKALAGMPTIALTGALEYQACDDKLCYNPARVPFTFTLTTKAIDRRPPGK